MSARFEDVLARDGRLVHTTTGTSMLPMLREKRDLIVVERPKGRLSKYDVALYRDAQGKCILHRVIRVEPDGYVLRGDHNRASEHGIREEQVIGALTAFVRDGREISVRSAGYRLYARLWCALYLPRMALRAPRALARRVLRRWRGKRMSVEANRAGYEAMYRLLSAWLHEQPLDLPGVDFESLARAAERHSLSAAVCFALERTGMASRCPAETLERLQKIKLASIRKRMLMDAERAWLLAFLEEEGIWYAPLKGIVLNDFYPELGAREFSDNDILFDAARWRTVLEFMKRRGYSAKDIGRGAHDAYWKPPVYSFEMHRMLFADDQRGGPLSACAAHFANPRQLLRKDAGNAFGHHFSDEEFYVHVLAHAYKHFCTDGTGIRTLLDIYLYRARKPELDEARIARTLDALGIAEFEESCRSLGRKLFDFPSRLDELSDAERLLLDVMQTSGTFGTLEQHVRSEMERMRREGEAPGGGARAKCRYVWRRLFPEMGWYRTEAPRVYRHRWLLPFYWLYRLYRGLWRNGAKNLRMLKLALGASADEREGEDE